MSNNDDAWNSSQSYDYFMGRWSRLMAPVFLDWLRPSAQLSWLDLGCGTGALSEAIVEHCHPDRLTCMDASPGYVNQLRERLAGKADFVVGSAMEIPGDTATYDIVVSSLALNFFSDLPAAMAEMQRVVVPHGTIAACVWDYAGRMDFLRRFWDTACDLNPAIRDLDEGVRFPICNATRLEAAFQEAGLTDISSAHLDIDIIFKDFEDYWQPFLGGQGPAPGYVASLSDDKRNALKNALAERLPVQTDGSITLLARAIAVRGTNGVTTSG